MAGVSSNVKRCTYTPIFAEICNICGVTVKQARVTALSAAKRAAKYSDTIRMNTSELDVFARKLKLQTFYNVCNELATAGKSSGCNRRTSEVALIALVASKCKRYQPSDTADRLPVTGSVISEIENAYDVVRHDWTGLTKSMPVNSLSFVPEAGPILPGSTAQLFGSRDPMRVMNAPMFDGASCRDEYWYNGVPIFIVSCTGQEGSSYMRKRLLLVDTIFSDSDITLNMKMFTTQCALRLR